MARGDPPQVPPFIAALNHRYTPWLGSAALAGCAALSFPWQTDVLVGLMLFLPLLDRAWKPPGIRRDYRSWAMWLVLLLATVTVVFFHPEQLPYVLTSFLIAALPEEWFFRAYLMTRIGTGLRANLLASLAFALLHGLSRGWLTAALVFVPSLAFGWIYQRSRDLALVVLVHLLANLIYVAYLADALESWLADLFR